MLIVTRLNCSHPALLEAYLESVIWKPALLEPYLETVIWIHIWNHIWTILDYLEHKMVKNVLLRYLFINNYKAVSVLKQKIKAFDVLLFF